MRCARPKRLSCPLSLNESGFEGDVFVSREANGLAPTCSGWPATPHKAEQSRTSRRHLQNTYARCPLGTFRLRPRQPLSKNLDQKISMPRKLRYCGYEVSRTPSWRPLTVEDQ